MNDFFKRNIPVFIIGLVTIAVFVAIIITASKNPTAGPSLKKVGDEKLINDNTPTVGPKDAKVILVEFSDFQCPACKAFHPTVSSLIEKYKDRVLFVYKNFPLPMHNLAKSAAIAGEAANEQGKFWEYAEKLFDVQPDFNRDNFIKIAGDLGLDKNKFAADLDNPAMATRVEEDLAQAQRIGLDSTPSFILNNKILTLRTYQDLEDEIIKELQNNNITIESTQSAPETSPSALGQPKPVTPSEMDSAYGTIDISYEENGFFPNNAKALVGQLVHIKNNTGLAIGFEQIIYLYTNLDNPLTIKPGESLDIRMEKEGLWTFKENKHKHYGSIFSVVKE